MDLLRRGELRMAGAARLSFERDDLLGSLEVLRDIHGLAVDVVEALEQGIEEYRARHPDTVEEWDDEEDEEDEYREEDWPGDDDDDEDDDDEDDDGGRSDDFGSPDDDWPPPTPSFRPTLKGPAVWCPRPTASSWPSPGP